MTFSDIFKNKALLPVFLCIFYIFLKQAHIPIVSHVEAVESSVTVLMPFDGKWASKKDKVTPPYHDDDNDSHPSLHDAYGANWGTDIYGLDKDVRINIDDPSNTFKLRVIQVTNNGCNAGKRVRIGIKNSAGEELGWVQFEHLETGITSKTPIENHSVLGKTKKWDYSECYRVRTNEGVHTHVVMKNNVKNTFSCYIDRAYAGIQLNQTEGLGIVGAGTNGPGACALPTATPLPPKSVTKTENKENEVTKQNFFSRIATIIKNSLLFFSKKESVSNSKEKISIPLKITPTSVAVKRITGTTCTGQHYSFIPPPGYTVKEVTNDKFANFTGVGQPPCPYYELIKENNDGYHNITVNRNIPTEPIIPSGADVKTIRVGGYEGNLVTIKTDSAITDSDYEFLQKYKNDTNNSLGMANTYEGLSEGEKRIYNINLEIKRQKGITAYFYRDTSKGKRENVYIEFPNFGFRTSSVDDIYLQDFKNVLESFEIKI